jgi:hypothetical protein
MAIHKPTDYSAEMKNESKLQFGVAMYPMEYNYRKYSNILKYKKGMKRPLLNHLTWRNTSKGQVVTICQLCKEIS